MVRARFWPILFLILILFVTLESVNGKNEKRGAARYKSLAVSKTTHQKSVAAAQFGFFNNFGFGRPASVPGRPNITPNNGISNIITDVGKAISDLTNKIINMPEQMNRLVMDGVETVNRFGAPIGDMIANGMNQGRNVIADTVTRISELISGDGTFSLDNTDVISNFVNQLINTITGGSDQAARFIFAMERRKMEMLCNMGEKGRSSLFNGPEQFRRKLTELEHMKIGVICNAVNSLGDMLFNGTEQMSNFIAGLEQRKMDTMNSITEEGTVVFLNGTGELSDAMKLMCDSAEQGAEIVVNGTDQGSMVITNGTNPGNGTISEVECMKTDMICSMANQMADGTRQGSQGLAYLERLKMRILTDITKRMAGLLFGVTDEVRDTIAGLERMKMQMLCDGMKDGTNRLSNGTARGTNTIADLERKKMDLMCDGTSQANNGSLPVLIGNGSG